MAFGGFNEQGNGGVSQPMSDINVTPLVDVMLVLLIIFIVTAPLLTHGIRIDLPKAASTANPQKPETVTVSIDAAGKVFWNDKRIADADLPKVMADAAAKKPEPELHFRGDRNTKYEKIMQVMSLAKNAGLTKLGFVTDPTLGGVSGQ